MIQIDTLRIVVFVMLINSVVGALLILVRHHFINPPLQDTRWPTLWNSGIMGKIGTILFFCGIATPVFLSMIIVFITIFLPMCFIIQKIYDLCTKKERSKT